jgi:hypothetical protein
MNIEKLYKLYDHQIKELESNHKFYGKADCKHMLTIISIALDKIICSFDNEDDGNCIRFKELQDKCISIKESVV